MVYLPILVEKLKIGDQFVEDRNSTFQIVYEVIRIDEDQIQAQSVNTGLINYFEKDLHILKILF